MNEKTGLVLRRVITGSVAVILLLAAGLALKHVFHRPPGAAESVDTPVRTMEVRKAVHQESLVFAGRVFPVQEAVVSAEIAQRIVEVTARLGDQVKKGDLLLRLENSLAKAEVVKASAEAEDASRELARLATLAGSGAVSQSVLDSARKRAEMASAVMVQAEAMMDKCEVRAPIDGRIENRYLEPGEFSGEGKPAFRVADCSRVKVRTYLPEADVVKVEPGDNLVFSVSAYPERQFTGTVCYVSRAAEPGYHSFAVELESDNSEGLLLGGMIADVQLVRASSFPVFRVPFAAVMPRKGVHVVFTAQNGVAVRKTVGVASMTGEYILVSSGLEDGDMVVIEGQRDLQDGRRVEIVE